MTFTYTSSESPIVITRTPTVEFDQRVPRSFIQMFLSYMGKGRIKVYDYQGNELKVYYGSE